MDLRAENKIILQQYAHRFPEDNNLLDLAKQLDEYMKAFEELDHEKKGELDLDEAIKLFKLIGRERSRLEIKTMLTNVDTDLSGVITYQSFINMMLLDDGVISSRLEPVPGVKMKHARLQKLKKKKRGHLKVSCSLEMAQEGFELTVMVGEGKRVCPRKPLDTYVKLYIEPDTKKETKKKTTVKKRSADPVWNEEFTWKLEEGEISKRRLFIGLWEYHHIHKNHFLGGMSFGLQDILDMEEPAAGWFILLDEIQGSRHNFPSPKSDLENKEPMTKMMSDLTPRTPRSQKFYSLEDFTFYSILGKGNFGKVILAEDNSNQQTVAIKVLKKQSLAQADDVGSALVEKRALEQCEGAPYLLRLFGTFATAANIYFVLEPVLGGDLMTHLMNQKAKRFTPAITAFYTAELCYALWFLHERNIIYRDVKLDNILLDGDGHLRLVDLGLAKDGVEPGEFAYTFCGTPNYIAPEIVEYHPYTHAVDFWAVGVLIYEMLTGVTAFQGEDEMAIYDAIIKGEVDYPSYLNKHSKSVIAAFLTKDPKDRLGSGDKKSVRDHAFFSSINWAKMESRKSKPPIKIKVPKPEPKEPVDKDTIVTPTDPDILDTIDQELFEDFTTGMEYNAV